MEVLSIVIPVFNEKKTINEIIKRVENVKIPKVKKEVIIVDDGSTDGTKEILKRINKHKILFHKKNAGKGSAVLTGIKHSIGTIIVIQDADLEYDPKEFRKLIVPILKKEYSVVYGSRLLGKKEKLFGKNKTLIPTHYIGNKILSLCTRIIYFSQITDMETGYKMFRKEVIKNIKLKSRRFDLEPEITSKILRQGYKILEIPIKFNPRNFTEGKKITWKDGLIALCCLIKYRFVN